MLNKDICVGSDFNFYKSLEIWKYLPRAPIHNSHQTMYWKHFYKPWLLIMQDRGKIWESLTMLLTLSGMCDEPDT